MSNAKPARASKSVAVTVIGLLTLVCGGGYATLGGSFILAGTGWFEQADPDPWKQIGALFGILPVLLVVIGVPFLVFGILLVLAALGVLWRKQWGRIVTIIAAVPVILLGLLWLSGVQDVRWDITELALGVAQVLYGILALVILIRKTAEFSRWGLSEPK
jgi:hypothetical protein